MTPEILNMIAQFMSRVDLKAVEIDAYQTCMAEIQRAFEEAQKTPTEGGPEEEGADEPADA